MEAVAVPVKPETLECSFCEGRGELYFGAPDALGTESETCEFCGGTGKR